MVWQNGDIADSAEYGLKGIQKPFVLFLGSDGDAHTVGEAEGLEWTDNDAAVKELRIEPLDRGFVVERDAEKVCFRGNDGEAERVQGRGKKEFSRGIYCE